MTINSRRRGLPADQFVIGHCRLRFNSMKHVCLIIIICCGAFASSGSSQMLFPAHSSNEIARTNLSGPTDDWVRQNSGVSVTLNGISYSDVFHGVVVGNGGTILTTTDGGAHWLSQTSGVSEDLYDVKYWASKIVAVGGHGTILYSTDGGSVWTRQQSGTTKNLFSVTINDQGISYAAGDSGVILRAWDASAGWMDCSVKISSRLTSVIGYRRGWYLDPAVIVVGTRGVILHSSDYGNTWTNEIPIDTSYQYWSVGCTSDRQPFIAGTQTISQVTMGLFLSTTDQGYNWTPMYALYPPGTSGPDANAGYAPNCGYQYSSFGAAIRRSADGGITWPDEKQFTGIVLHGMFVSDGFIAAAGDSGCIVGHPYWPATGVTPVYPTAGMADVPILVSTPARTGIALFWHCPAPMPSCAPISYYIRISDDSTFSSGSYNSTASTNDSTFFFQAPTLGQTYFWRVISSGTGGYTAISPTFRFSMHQGGASTRFSPPDGATDLPMAMGNEFLSSDASWSKTPARHYTNYSGPDEPAQYVYQISRDSLHHFSLADPSYPFFMVDSAGGGTMSGSFTNLEPLTKYFWRMQAVYTSGGYGWTDVWSFTTGDAPSRLTCRDIQKVDDDSLHRLDSLHRSPGNTALHSSYENTFAGVTMQCVVPSGDLARDTLTLIGADSGMADQPWRSMPAQVYSYDDAHYALFGLTYDDFLTTMASFKNIQRGDVISMFGTIVEAPANSPMSNTVFRVLKINSIRSHSTVIRAAPTVQITDFYRDSYTLFSTGESYEGSVVELHDVTVHSILDPSHGTFDVIDGAGNTLKMSDLSRWYTLADHRDPASTYAVPGPGWHVDTLRGVIVSENNVYKIAPVSPGDLHLAPSHRAITGRAFNDVNRDGKWDPGDIPFTGMTVRLIGKARMSIAADSGGFFSFSGLDSGTYAIVISKDIPWLHTDELTDTTVVNFTASEDSLYFDIGFFRPWNHFSGRVFLDINENGVQDDGEPAVPGWQIDVLGPTPDSTLADSSGNYSLDHVARGLNYFSSRPFAGWEQIYPSSIDSYGVMIDSLEGHYTGLNFAVHHIPQRIKLKLTAHDNSLARIQPLYFGNRGGATYGMWGTDSAASNIDFSEGETEIPPRMTGFFDARFMDVHGYPGRFWEGGWVDMRDYYSPAQVDTHLVVFSPGTISGANYPMTFAWDKTLTAAAYSGPVRLVDPTGAISPVDMKAGDSLVITNSGVTQLLLIDQGPKLSTISQKTWNMVSAPALTADNSVRSIFPMSNPDAYYFDQASGYIKSANILPKTGYWLKCVFGAERSITFLQPPSAAETLAVAEGWNMIGGPGAGVPAGDI